MNNIHADLFDSVDINPKRQTRLNLYICVCVIYPKKN